MTYEIIYKILSVISTLITLLTLVLSIIIAKTKNNKVKKDCNNLLTFMFKAQNVISKAEQFKNWTNEEQKQYVLSMLLADGADVGLNETEIDNLIENFVAFLNTRIKREVKDNGTKNN